MKEIVFLIGFRAVGKTTIGKKLADRLGFSFVDTDALICEKKGATVQAIVQAEGWEGFRRCEQEILAGLGTCRRCVIATGGGAILHQHLWPALKEQGYVVWLTADPDIICQRIHTDGSIGDAQRPSLTGKGVCDEIREVLGAREPLYRSTADLVVDTGLLGPSEVLEAVERAVGDSGQAASGES
jgi:shikimate kinase